MQDSLAVPLPLDVAEVAELESEASRPRPQLRLAITMSQKVQPVQFESAEVSMHVSGITAEMADEDVDQLVGKGKIAYSKMGQILMEKVKAARANHFG